MATITNPTEHELEVPIVGMTFAAGQTRDVGELSDTVAGMFRGHGVLVLEGHVFADEADEEPSAEPSVEVPPVVEEPAHAAPAVEGTVE